MKPKEGIYTPTLLDIRLARKVSRRTKSPELEGKVVPRGFIEILSLFARRRSTVVYENGKPVAHAGITHTFHLNGQRVEEVGAVLNLSEPRNGHAKRAIEGLVERRHKKHQSARIIAMVDEDNTASIRLFERLSGGRRLAVHEVPERAFSEKIPGGSEEIVFDITPPVQAKMNVA